MSKAPLLCNVTFIRIIEQIGLTGEPFEWANFFLCSLPQRLPYKNRLSIQVTQAVFRCPSSFIIESVQTGSEAALRIGAIDTGIDSGVR